jgi:chromosomal replication initiator protein
MDQEWQEIKKELRKSLSKGQYDLWVSTMDFIGLDEEVLTIGCRNRFHVEWLREKLEPKLLAAVVTRFPRVRKLEYQITEEIDALESQDKEPGLPAQLSFNELIRRPGLSFNSRFTFDQFVVGNCNQFAYAASMAMASGSQLPNQSVYLLSETGLGKSHLTHAVGNYMSTANPEIRVHYTTTEQFANEMIAALRNGSIDGFKNKFRMGCDVLLLERIEFLSGKERVQNELTYTLDELMDRGKKILCTGSAYPKDIPRLSTELRSRLGGLLVAPIDPPDFETRVKIINRKASCEGVRLPADVVEYLAHRITGDIRSLESCLVGMLAKRSILGVPITLQLAREVTQAMLTSLPKITIELIQRVVCESFLVSREELVSSSRRKEIALARKVGMYLSREYTKESLAAIGKAFERSHSSVLYAVAELNKKMQAQATGKLKRQVEYVSRRLETSCLAIS